MRNKGITPPINSLFIALAIFLVVARVPDCSGRAIPPTETMVIYTAEEAEEFVGEEEMNFIGTGTSMLPLFPSGSVCRCVKTEDYRVGDIINYRVETEEGYLFIMHRVVEVLDNELYLAKGDNNLWIDPRYIREEDIVCEIPQIPIWKKILSIGSGGLIS